MNVLSLCDGMSCGQMAFEKLGLKVNEYYASEIKEIAIKATKYNFPQTICIGDVKKIKYKNGILYTENKKYKTKFDVVIFGSPCQSFSRAMIKSKRIGLKDIERSGLFFECYRVLKEASPSFFLVENVIMRKEDEQIISNMLGVKPIRINSSLVSAQLRDRYYWTNIPDVTIPQDRGIKLQNVLINGYTPDNKAKCLCKNESKGYYNGCNWTPIKRFHRYYYLKFGNMIFPSKEYFEKCLKCTQTMLKDRKSTAKIYDNYIGNGFKKARYLWKEERARLQTVPEKYVECMSEQEAADLLGDGWTVDIIAHILKGLLYIYRDN